MRTYESNILANRKFQRTTYKTGAVANDSWIVGDHADHYKLVRSDIIKRIKSADGWRDPTNYSASLITYFHPQGEFTYIVNGDKYETWGGQTPEQKGAAAIPAFPSGLRQRAEVNALTKLKDQKMNLAQAFGERAQTTRLVANSLNSLVGMKRKMIEGMTSKQLGRKADRALKPSSIADRWLELQYGWKPLLGDIYGAVELLDAADRREGPRRYRMSFTGKVRTDSRVVREYSDNNKMWKAKETTRVMHGCFVKLYYEPSDAAPFQSLAQAGITNPLELAWELLPYSFIVDWAIPIGNWLSVLDADIGWKFLSGTRSEITRLRQGTVYSKGVSPYAVSAHGRQAAQRLSFTRTVLSGTPIPRPPSFKDPRSTLHLLNALALLGSAFGRGKSNVRY